MRISGPGKLFFSILLFVLLGWTVFGVFNWFSQQHHEDSARQKLDTLLGKDKDSPESPESDAESDPEKSDPNQPNDSHPPTSIPGLPKEIPGIPKNFFRGLPPAFSGPFGRPLFSLPSLSNLDNGVEVQEKPDRYILRIPLASPQDANQVKLNVTPDRIEISGQTGSHSHGVSSTSSFMQSFSTSDRVLPDKMTKKTEKQNDNTVLVITIPKQHPSSKSSGPHFIQPGNPSPETPNNDQGVPVEEGNSQHPVI